MGLTAPTPITCDLQCRADIAVYMKYWPGAPEVPQWRDTIDPGQLAYFEHCATCHGEEGSGQPHRVEFHKFSPEQLTSIIESGTGPHGGLSCNSGCADSIPLYLTSWTTLQPKTAGMGLDGGIEGASVFYRDCMVCHGESDFENTLPLDLDAYSFFDLAYAIDQAPGPVKHQCYGSCAIAAAHFLKTRQASIKPDRYFTIRDGAQINPYISFVDGTDPATVNETPIVDVDIDAGFVEFPLAGLEGKRLILQVRVDDNGHSPSEEILPLEYNGLDLAFYPGNGEADLEDYTSGQFIKTLINANHVGTTFFAVDVSSELEAVIASGASHIGFKFYNVQPFYGQQWINEPELVVLP